MEESPLEGLDQLTAELAALQECAGPAARGQGAGAPRGGSPCRTCRGRSGGFYRELLKCLQRALDVLHPGVLARQVPPVPVPELATVRGGMPSTSAAQVSARTRGCYAAITAVLRVVQYLASGEEGAGAPPGSGLWA